MNNALQPFHNQQYLNLETFRKNGQGVKTPVWFAQEDENTLRVWTQADSGKVKRVRRDGSVRIAPSTAAGAPLGEWMHAQATVLDAPEQVQYTKELFHKKYGWMFNMFHLLGKMRKASYTSLQIKVNS